MLSLSWDIQKYTPLACQLGAYTLARSILFEQVNTCPLRLPEGHSHCRDTILLLQIIRST